MRILYVTNESPIFPSGGIGTYIGYMASAMERAGHEVFLLTWTYQPRSETYDYWPFKSENTRICYLDGVQVHRQFPQGPYNYAVSAILSDEILSCAIEWQIEVIESADFLAPSLRAFQHIQSSNLSHNILCSTFNHGFIEDYNDADQIASSVYTQNELTSERQQLRISDLILTPSVSARSRLHRYGITENIVVMREPYAFQMCTPCDSVHPSMQFLGRLCLSKGVDKIPLSYASLFGGIITLVGTSTNLVVNSFTVGAGLPALGMFQFAWVGLPTALICILVLSLSSRLLPDNLTADEKSSSQRYFLEAQVQQESPLVGKTIEQNRLRRLDGLFLVEILRERRLISPVSPEEVVLAGDVLIFSGETEKVQTLKQFEGLAVFGAHAPQLLHSNLVEVIISNESELANRTLRDVDFRTMFDAGVVGIRRGDRQLRGQLGQITLHVGDSLLLAVGPDFKQHRNIDRNFHVLDDTLQRPVLNTVQSAFTMSGFAAVILLSALEWVPLFSGLLVLLTILLITRILTLSELRRRFPFELMIIIASALSVAHALDASGAADLIANAMRSAFDVYGVTGAFIGVYLITLVLTELITNNAAAALAFPIALSTAKAFGVDPTPFIMVIAYAASACFMFPFGYQTHLMVYSPGRYRVKDFFKVGFPITIVYSLCILILVPIFFPF